MGAGARNDFHVPPVVHEVLRSPGKPLDATTRTFLEPRLGYDFSRVRVHTDEHAAEVVAETRLQEGAGRCIERLAR